MKAGKKSVNGGIVTVEFKLLKKEVEGIHSGVIGSVPDTATYKQAVEYSTNNKTLTPRISQVTGGGKITIKVTHKEKL